MTPGAKSPNCPPRSFPSETHGKLTQNYDGTTLLGGTGSEHSTNTGWVSNTAISSVPPVRHPSNHPSRVQNESPPSPNWGSGNPSIRSHSLFSLSSLSSLVEKIRPKRQQTRRERPMWKRVGRGRYHGGISVGVIPWREQCWGIGVEAPASRHQR